MTTRTSLSDAVTIRPGSSPRSRPGRPQTKKVKISLPASFVERLPARFLDGPARQGHGGPWPPSVWRLIATRTQTEVPATHSIQSVHSHLAFSNRDSRELRPKTHASLVQQSRGPFSLISNRHTSEIEVAVTHSKQTTAVLSNRHKLRGAYIRRFLASRPPGPHCPCRLTSDLQLPTSSFLEAYNDCKG
jgi:hypothetical protein